MSAAAALGQLHQVAGEIERFPQWLTNQVDRAVNVVNGLLNAVPFFLEHLVGSIIEQARALLQQIGELAQQFIDWLHENVIPFLLGPFTLHQAGDDWTTTVFSETTNVAGRMDTSEKRVGDYWGGPAASAYGSVIPRQRAAAEQAGEMASQLRQMLQTLAITLVGVYVAVAATIAIVMVKIIAAIAAKVTVVGIPAGLVAFVTALLTAVGGGMAAIGIARNAGETFLGQVATLREMQHDNSVWRNGSWPEATAELAEPELWSPK